MGLNIGTFTVFTTLYLFSEIVMIIVCLLISVTPLLFAQCSLAEMANNGIMVNIRFCLCDKKEDWKA